ncbi:MAG: DEAD/DEAH box helicase [Candidatus Obscuribacterales bacterium]|nr:DEAD/DEAH box helicase [Steroidobacteraceae bacterium]
MIDTTTTFQQLALSAPVLQALKDVGYESPSPIQAATIPHLLAGKDVLGQAQTGTGKTAAFALPILSNLDIAQTKPQALVLAPTRELAIQVAEAFQRYASHLPGFHVVPIYGGQSYTPQLQSLRRGVHVVVGTPGRIMDHLKRGTLALDALKYIVLDEADEMLRMGFIDDVNWILEQAPAKRQVALFSATMPPQIRRIAQQHLNSPTEVTIKSKTATAANIRQRYWVVSGMHKLDALTRVLEVENFDAMLVFTRTKQSTEELAERLAARGFSVEALNGDIAQAQRERTVARLKNGQVDIVVATDVAARGLDVERISHVVNFDVPYDSESYVHRIGRTGRAGRSGEAILFIAPRERNMLRVIERTTRQPIEPMQMPTMEAVNEQRVTRFKQKITDALAGGEASKYRFIVEQYESEHAASPVDIAAALITMAQGRTPLLVDSRERASGNRERDESPRGSQPEYKSQRPARPDRDAKFAERAPRTANDNEAATPQHKRKDSFSQQPRPNSKRPREDVPMETYRVEVGHAHGVKPGNIVGAIANEAGIEGQLIGRVDIRDNYSLVDLPEGMPKEIFRQLKKARVAGQELRISPVKLPGGAPERVNEKPSAPPRPSFDRAATEPPRFDRGAGPQRDKPHAARPNTARAGATRSSSARPTLARADASRPPSDRGRPPKQRQK